MATDLTKLTKLQLEALGREYDIELDRRLTKAKLVEQLDAHIKWCACGKTEDPNGACDGSHAKVAKTLHDLKSEEIESSSNRWWAYLTTKPESYRFVGATGSCKCKDERGHKLLKFENTEAVQKFAREEKAQVVAQDDYFILVR